MNYAKYANLPHYIFDEVRERFHQRGFLTAEEFFCIVIWKANRAKGKLKKKLLEKGELEKVVKELTSNIHQEPDYNEKLRLLIEKWKFRLPIASAILAVLYPDTYVVYDVRIRGELGITNFSGKKNVVDLYFNEYLSKAKVTAEGTTMRAKDNYLWGKSFYKGLIKFLNEER